ncbi:MAG: YqiA/YcfP family alpha/beta fold hydrolase [Pseudomonadota bacterium]|nr:YqiA/YcfP family alpha/beta fold hydrolase [Pseudomonadota bacterium]
MNKRDLILYVHGWNSHANARKAQLIEYELKNHEIFDTASLTLKNHPKEAINQLTEFILEKQSKYNVHLVGSSLGGYYSVFLAETLNLKAAMINPAVWAYKIFENDRGDVENLNTGEKYFIDQAWIDSLEDIFIENPTPDRYLVLLQTGDETLDYKYAEKYFSGARTVIDEGGSHSFDGLEQKIPQILLHFS